MVTIRNQLPCRTRDGVPAPLTHNFRSGGSVRSGHPGKRQSCSVLHATPRAVGPDAGSSGASCISSGGSVPHGPFSSLRRRADTGRSQRLEPNRAQLQGQEGPTGLNVGGARPTSPLGWNLMMRSLKEAKVELVSSQELIFAQDKGHLVLDIRPKADYEKGHIPGAVNVPFYQQIQGWTPWQVLRRVGFAAFGILNGTEVNPNFDEEVSKHVEGGRPFVLYCSMGGHLDPIDVGATSIPAPEDMDHGPAEGAGGKRKLQSRSMIAAYQLLIKGHTNMSILKGGFSDWRRNGRSIETAAPQ